MTNLTRNPQNPQIYLSSESTSRWRWIPQNGTCFTVPAWRDVRSSASLLLLNTLSLRYFVFNAPAVVAKLATNSVVSFVRCIVINESFRVFRVFCVNYV